MAFADRRRETPIIHLELVASIDGDLFSEPRLTHRHPSTQRWKSAIAIWIYFRAVSTSLVPFPHRRKRRCPLQWIVFEVSTYRILSFFSYLWSVTHCRVERPEVSFAKIENRMSHKTHCKIARHADSLSWYNSATKQKMENRCTSITFE